VRDEEVLRFPILCPACGAETLFSAPVALIVQALATGGPIALRTGCCNGREWMASALEIEQISDYADISVYM
jgi:hypothetical protein